MTDLLDIERRLKQAVAAIPERMRPELLRILTMPNEERADAIGKLFQAGAVPSLSELLIDLEETPAARALVVGQLRAIITSES